MIAGRAGTIEFVLVCFVFSFDRKAKERGALRVDNLLKTKFLSVGYELGCLSPCRFVSFLPY